MAINFLEVANLPKKKSGKLLYGAVLCRNMKESRKLFKLLDEIIDWRFVEGVGMNGTKVTVTFFRKNHNGKTKPEKKTVPYLRKDKSSKSSSA